MIPHAARCPVRSWFPPPLHFFFNRFSSPVTNRRDPEVPTTIIIANINQSMALLHSWPQIFYKKNEFKKK